jgi:hypothetical protein
MSEELKVTHSGPATCAPQLPHSHAGKHGVRFESVDARPRLVILSLAIIVGMLVLVFAVTLGVQKYLVKTNPPGSLPSPLAPARVLPPEPQLEARPWENLPVFRAHEEQVLNEYGKDANGHLHIPIERAVEAVVPRLPVRPDAPSGITTPGGQGREFAGSVNTIEASSGGPKIKGAIRKHAQ